MIIERTITRSWHCYNLFSQAIESLQTFSLYFYRLLRIMIIPSTFNDATRHITSEENIRNFSLERIFEIKVFQFNYHQMYNLLNCLTRINCTFYPIIAFNKTSRAAKMRVNVTRSRTNQRMSMRYHSITLSRRHLTHGWNITFRWCLLFFHSHPFKLTTPFGRL